MEVFSCVAAAASLAKTCFSTAKALHNLYEKYRNARSAIGNLHSEIVAIGAGIQFINEIFKRRPKLAHERFDANSDLEQTLSVSLAGCSLVMSCLNEEVERIQKAVDSDGFTGQMGIAQLIWKEDVMKDLLDALRGQHSAVASIVQCFQLQDIAELGRKVDDLCVVVINNHTGVETALRKSPSVALSQPGDNPGNVGPSSAAQSSAASTISASEAEGLDSESISSSEKVAKSYRHYQDAMSVFSTKKSWRKRAVEAFDETASLHGLAPSTIVAYNPSVDNESVAEHHPVFPTVSIDVRMQNWLDAQVGADGYLKVPQRVPSRASLSRLSFFDAGNSIAAPDTQTFLENIRYFMPSITDLDNTASGVDSDSSKRIEGSSETTRHLQTLPPYNTPREQGNLHEDGSEDVSKGNRTPLTVVSFPNETNTTDEEASLTELDSLPSKSLFSTENEEEGTIFTTPSANSSKVGHDKLEIPPLEGELTNLVEHELQSTGFSIYAEKNNYHLGTVICSSGADSSSRVSHGLLQALAPHDTDSEVVCDSPLESPGLPVGQKSPSRMARRQSVLESMGATIYFVAR